MNRTPPPPLPFEYHPPQFTAMGLVWSLAAIGLIAVSLAVEKAGPVAWFAAIPACWAIASFRSRPRAIAGTITESGIELIEPATTIPAESIIGLSSPGRNPAKPGKRFPIHVHHDGGFLTIPAKVDVLSSELYDALSAVLAGGSGRTPHAVLGEYHTRQAEIFGEDRVFAFRALKVRARDRESRRSVRRYAIWSFLAAAILIGGGFLQSNIEKDAGPLFGIAGAVSLFGVISFLLSFVGDQVVGVKNWQESAIVISPLGLALAQGDIRGELTWEQLRDVKYNPTTGSFRVSTHGGYGMVLRVEGADIVVFDIYNRPLSDIHARIFRYWRPGMADVIDL